MLKETCRGFGLFFSNDLCYSPKLALFGLFVWYKKEGSMYSRNRAFSLNNSLQTYQNLPFFLTKFFYLGEIVIFVVQAHVKSDELIQNLLVKQTAKTLKIFCFSFFQTNPICHTGCSKSFFRKEKSEWQLHSILGSFLKKNDIGHHVARSTTTYLQIVINRES